MNELKHEWLEEARFNVPDTKATVILKTEAWWGELDSKTHWSFLAVGIATLRVSCVYDNDMDIDVPFLSRILDLADPDAAIRHCHEFGVKRTDWLRRVAELHDEAVARMCDPITVEEVTKALETPAVGGPW